MRRNSIAGVLAAALAFGPGCTPSGGEVSPEHASGGSSSEQAYDQYHAECGPDVIRLWAERDPEIRALSEAAFGARWFARLRCLAELGDAESQLTMGIAYRDGSDGPPQDYSEAAVWFRRAADQGNPLAQLNLAQLYQHGRGVPQDLVRAHMWYNLAITGFDWPARTRATAFSRRDQLESRMTLAQVREAQRMASEWWTERNR